METKPTLAEVAKAAGVHISTASRALRNSHLISEARREAIQGVAKRLGYQPDPHASSLIEGRWRKERRERAVVCAYLTEHPWNAFERHRLNQLSEWSAEIGYQLVRIEIGPKTTPRSLLREMMAKNVRTVLLQGLSQPWSLELFSSPKFPWHRFAWVAVNERTYDPPVHRVIFNTFREMMDCLNQMYDHGYRRVGVITSPEQEAMPVEKQEAAMRQFQATHSEFTLIHVPFTDFKKESRQAALANEADALLFTFYMARSAILPILENLPYASLRLWPNWVEDVAGTTLAHEALFRSAFNLLDFQFRRDAPSIPQIRHTIVIDCHWCDGPSLPRKE